ncbi:MAG TPA: DUF2149 domain-containing protein [Mycobacteriales bacterium]|jgi:hypothetical protein|nr:DUF2149 domain-containing protein [Mycobacteriales bacterium]
MIAVTPRARRREDRAGDPLDGLVNLFDLGIVLAVAFLLAALTSLHLTGALTGGLKPKPDQIVIKPGQTVQQVPAPGGTVFGHGKRIGEVYRLPNGKLVLVTTTGRPSSGTGH